MKYCLFLIGMSFLGSSMHGGRDQRPFFPQLPFYCYIRTYRSTDLKKVKNLLFKEQYFLFDDPITATQVKKYIKSCAKDKEGDNCKIKVIYCQKKLCGALVSYHKHKHSYIDKIAVKSSCRGQGCGTALIDKTVKSAKQAAQSKIVLKVFHTNERAKQLYKKLGFATTSEGRVDVMEKSLN
jgi:ribosomal protein S18 acetylase RimI-like enzyme